MKKIMMIVNLLALLSNVRIQSMEDDEQAYISHSQHLYKYKDSTKSDKELSKIMRAIVSEQELMYLLNTAAELIREGANPNIKFMGESLLHKAVIMKAKDLINALFEHNVDCTDTHYLIGPIFFDAPNIEIAQLLIDKGVDVNSKNGNDQNVLWHLVDSKFPVDLVDFYLNNNVNASHIDKWDKSSVLHSFAGYKDIQKEDVFLEKARLILKKSPALVSLVDHNGETPTIVAENTIAVWGKKYPACVSRLQKLINLFKGVV